MCFLITNHAVSVFINCQVRFFLEQSNKNLMGLKTIHVCLLQILIVLHHRRMCYVHKFIAVLIYC